MILRIEERPGSRENTFYVPYEWLSNKAVHLYLASQMWDSVVVVLDDAIPKDVLKYITSKGKMRRIIVGDKGLTDKCVDLACEIYPEKAGAIHKAYMMGKDITSVL